jgi:hypothetical protein
MQRHDVALCQQITQARGRLGVPMTELVRVIVENHPHSQRFREIRELRADIAVSNNAERLAPYLIAVVCGLVPTSLMRCIGTRDDPAQQNDDLAYYQLRDASRVGKRGVKYGNPALASGVNIHLIGADTEASDRDEAVRGLQNVRGDLRA